MNLRQPHDGHRYTAFTNRQPGELTCDAGHRVAPIKHVLAGERAWARTAHADRRGDDEGPVRSGEHVADRLDDPAVLLAILGIVREVVVECGVDHGMGILGTFCQPLRIIKVAAVDGSAGLLQSARASVGPRIAYHLVPGRKQFGQDP